MRRHLRRWRVPILAGAILGAGVGASAALLGLFDLLAVRAPSHVRDPDRVVEVATATRFADYRHLREAVTLTAAAVRRGRALLEADDGVREGTVECVTPGFFSVLGVGGALPDLTAGNEEPRAVVSPRFLAGRLEGVSRPVVGRTIRVAGRRHVVAGVAPRGFSGVQLDPPDVWILIAIDSEACVHAGRDLASAGVTTVARFRDGVTRDQAEREVRRLLPVPSAAPDSPALRPLHEVRAPRLRHDIGIARWGAGASLLLLAMSCTGAGALLTLGVTGRRRELAIRHHLGASTRRIAWLLCADWARLAAATTLVAILVALGTIVAVGTEWPAVLEWPVVDAALARRAGALTVLACTLSAGPAALRAWRARTPDALRGDHLTPDGRSPFAVALLAAQMAMTFALIAGAGLMLRSVGNLTRDAGYDVDRLLAVVLHDDPSRYESADDVERFVDRLTAFVRAVPGVVGTAATSGDLLFALGDSVALPVHPSPGPPRVGDTVTSRLPVLQFVDDGYFAIAGTPILRGRGFGPRDGLGRPVLVVDESTAAALWPGQDPVGRCAFVGGGADCFEVLGVTATRRFQFLTTPTPEVFMPRRQRGRAAVLPAPGARLVIARVDGPAAAIAAAVASAIRQAAPTARPVTVHRVEDLAGVHARSWKVAAKLFAVFGLCALAIGATGLYATLAAWARQRRRATALRLALGASRGRVLAELVGSTLLASAAGLAVGTLGVGIAGPFARWLVFGVDPLDPLTLGAAAACVAGAAVAGAVVPAIRTLTVNPAEVLRDS